MILVTAALFGALTIGSAIQGWFVRWTTEIAVTDRRVIYKRGFINRHTIEMKWTRSRVWTSISRCPGGC